jgi:hypothetical protein
MIDAIMFKAPWDEQMANWPVCVATPAGRGAVR